MNGADGGEKNGKEAKSRPAPGQGDLRLTRWGRRARLWAKGKLETEILVSKAPVARVYAQGKTHFSEADGRNGFASVDQAMEIRTPTRNQLGRRGMLTS
jgi:hypothetical protein